MHLLDSAGLGGCGRPKACVFLTSVYLSEKIMKFALHKTVSSWSCLQLASGYNTSCKPGSLLLVSLLNFIHFALVKQLISGTTGLGKSKEH